MGHVPGAQGPAVTWAWGKSRPKPLKLQPRDESTTLDIGDFNTLYVRATSTSGGTCITSPGRLHAQLQISPGQTQRQT